MGECGKNPGFMMIKCQKSCDTCGKCFDAHTDKCPGWADSGECQSNASFMLVECAKSCGVCGEETTTIEPTDPPADDCTDEFEKCPEWASTGECGKNPGFMMTQCQKSCDTCGKCFDAHTDKCPGWAESGECEANASFMSVECAKSCGTGVCEEEETTTVEPTDPPADDCTDEHEKCSEWASTGECGKNPGFMMTKCQKSCDTCGKCFDAHTDKCPGWAESGECVNNANFMSVECAKSCGTGNCEGETALEPTDPPAEETTTI